MTADPGATRPVEDGASPPPAAQAVEGVAETLGHLQAAALSLVAALRAALDAAEHLARDPAPLLDLLVDASRAKPGGGPDKVAAPARDAPKPGHVEHITVRPQPGPLVDDKASGGSDTRANGNGGRDAGDGS